MARDVQFLDLILKHTLKVADKSDGPAKQFMLEQADRIRDEIALLTPPKPTKKKAKKRTKR